MKLLVLVLPFLLIACAHQEPQVITKEVLKKISVPAELLQYCPELKTLGSNKLEDIIIEDLEYIEQYALCKKRQRALVDTIREVVK
jgi:hypothetical protein